MQYSLADLRHDNVIFQEQFSADINTIIESYQQEHAGSDNIPDTEAVTDAADLIQAMLLQVDITAQSMPTLTSNPDSLPYWQAYADKCLEIANSRPIATPGTDQYELDKNWLKGLSLLPLLDSSASIASNLGTATSVYDLVDAGIQLAEGNGKPLAIWWPSTVAGCLAAGLFALTLPAWLGAGVIAGIAGTIGVGVTMLSVVGLNILLSPDEPASEQWEHAIPSPIADLINAASAWIRRADPLALDLDGDGIETAGTCDMILFDHDGDLNRNATGWVKGDDGFLVLDRNGNGKIDNGSELFGVDTVMSNGLKASSGF